MRIKHILVIVVLTIALNSFGFCYKRMWFISDQERIEIAVNEVLRSDLHQDGVNIQSKLPVFYSQKDLNKSNSIIDKTVPYQSIGQFLKLNPNCCSVIRSDINDDVGLVRVSIWECITGYSPYFVKINYAFKYIEKGGLERVTPISRMYKISSCGKIRHE